jgi:hypothetical protein
LRLVSSATTTTVRLTLPAEILREVELPYEGVRDVAGIVVAIEGINLAASVVTLVTLQRYAPRLATAIRKWRLRQPRRTGDEPTTLTVQGPGISLSIDLPPNVNTQDLLVRLAPLLDPPAPEIE